MNKKLLGTITPVFLVFSMTSCSKNQIFNMNDQVCVNYLSATTSKDQFNAIYHNISSRTGVAHDIAIPYIMDCKSNGSENYHFHVAHNPEFKDEEVITTYIPRMNYGNLIPGETYYWKVYGTNEEDILNSGNFTVNENNVRWINAPSVGNVRDLGGWKLPGGKRIKFGKLYRGRNPDHISHADQTLFKDTLGIKTQLDLRKDTDSDPAPAKHAFDYDPKTETSNVTYCYYGDTLTYADVINKVGNVMNNGECIFTDDPGSSRQLLTGVQMFQNIFNRLANPNSYPIYFHCSSGADRTASLALLIEGLLGVSYEDIVRDFELTSFCSRIVGGRLRCDPNSELTDFDYSTDVYTTYDKWPEKGYQPKWPRLIKAMNEINNDLQKAVEIFLTDTCQISIETLNQVKANLVE